MSPQELIPFLPSRVPAPAAAAEAVVAADMRPLPGSPIRPGTSASPAAEAAAVEAAGVEAAAVAVVAAEPNQS